MLGDWLVDNLLFADDVMTPSAASRASVLKVRGGGEIRSSPEPESNQGHVADDELGCG